MAIRVTIEGTPRGKGRPRFSMRGGFPRAYTDAETRAYTQEIQLEARIAMVGKTKFARKTPLRATITACYTYPLRWSKSLKEMAKNWVCWRTEKPDLDNLVKMLDGLNGIVFEDDNQIAVIHAEKIYGEKPYLRFEIEALEDER